MILKSLAFVAVGAVAATAIPSIASTASESVTLTPGQIEFIRQFDLIEGTNFSNLTQSPAAIPIIKSASLACGNIELQKQATFSAGGNVSQAKIASEKFETLFCNN